MDTKERRFIFLHSLQRDTPFCVNCVYFVRHYIFSQSMRYEPLQLGHCIHGKRPKNTRAYDECTHFSNKHEAQGGNDCL